MRAALLSLTLWLGCLLLAPSAEADLSSGNYRVTGEPAESDFPLVDRNGVATLYLDSQEPPGLARAVKDLAQDIRRVTRKTPAIAASVATLADQGPFAVILGTLGQSPLLDELVRRGSLDGAAIAGQWDAYSMTLVGNPVPGIRKALVIAGANMRGAIYGAYDLSETIGVSPWHYWADVPVQQHKTLHLRGDLAVQQIPGVKYRGIFLNDEAPALTGWVEQNHGDYHHEFYIKVFELLLRLKGNFLWPAMWNNAFSDDDPLNPQLAHEYGIIMGTSHHEPMMRAHKEWERYGKGAWDYAGNSEVLLDFWRGGIRRNAPFESVITLGMRGDGDEPMTEGQNIDLLERIVADQRSIIADVHGSLDVPQVWCLYKEVQDYYDRGMRVPDDVTLLWADDNWGNIRRLPTPGERGRAGGAGVYYHFDYVGGPRSYRWINTTPIPKIWEQMHLAHAYGADRIWITNVGDLKPMEVPMEFFLRMAWQPDAWPLERMAGFVEEWAARDFGAELAQPIAELIEGYVRQNGRRKPEMVAEDTYSLLHYDEADRIEAELDGLVVRAQTLRRSIPKRQRDAYFQLVEHPVTATATVTKLHIAAARNQLHAAQGRVDANDHAASVERLFEADQNLRRQWDTQLSKGKWEHFMDQPHLGYRNWNNPPADTPPLRVLNRPHNQAEMGVAVEGQAAAWPSPPVDGDYELSFSRLGQPSRWLEIFNRGTKPFEYTIESDSAWLRVDRAAAMVETAVRVNVSVDWALLPPGRHQARLAIRGTSWETTFIKVTAEQPPAGLLDQATGFIEADGFIAIEAPNFSRRGSDHNMRWEVIPGFGRTDGGISTYPVVETSTEAFGSAPFVEYDISFTSSGVFETTVLLAPSWPFQPGRGLRYAIGLAGEEPVIVDFLADQSEEAWAESVSTGVRRGVSQLQIDEPGNYRLRIYRVDPGVTIQKIMIDTGGLQHSYLGPPESSRR